MAVQPTVEHSPGPWLNAGPFGFSIGIISQEGWVAVAFGPQQNPHADGNARLIVTAPRLLAACERLHQAVLAYGSIGYEGSEFLEAMSDAKEALAEAKGMVTA
jgi:hypothetical protein